MRVAQVPVLWSSLRPTSGAAGLLIAVTVLAALFALAWLALDVKLHHLPEERAEHWFLDDIPKGKREQKVTAARRGT